MGSHAVYRWKCCDVVGACMTVPHDPAAERIVLATACAPGNDVVAARIVSELREYDFIVPAHRAIFRGIRNLVQSSVEPNAVALNHELGGRVPYAVIVETLGAEETTNPDHMCAIIRQHTLRRSLLRCGEFLTREATDLARSPSEVSSEALGALADVSCEGRKGGLTAAGDIGHKVAERIEHERRHGKGRFVRSGLEKLDGMLRGGFRPGQLVILAARPKLGKTSLVLQWATRAALNGYNVAFFSAEMSEDEIYLRALSQHSGKTVEYIERNGIESVSEYDHELRSAPLLIDESGVITVPDIKARVDRANIITGGIDLIVVDYLQLLTSPDGQGKQNESVRIGAMSRGLKLLAKDKKVPVIVLSQLNRDVEKRQNGRPQLSDLRDSGAIEQDADIVMFIHRDARPGSESKTGELIVAAHRGGPQGVINLAWDGEVTRFREIEQTTGHFIERHPVWEDDL